MWKMQPRPPPQSPHSCHREKRCVKRCLLCEGMIMRNAAIGAPSPPQKAGVLTQPMDQQHGAQYVYVGTLQSKWPLASSSHPSCWALAGDTLSRTEFSIRTCKHMKYLKHQWWRSVSQSVSFPACSSWTELTMRVKKKYLWVRVIFFIFKLCLWDKMNALMGGPGRPWAFLVFFVEIKLGCVWVWSRLRLFFYSKLCAFTSGTVFLLQCAENFPRLHEYQTKYFSGEKRTEP